MYSVSDYGGMIADQTRMEPYILALRQNVTADSVVLDIGTGTGIFALLACQFGARKVYAIEPNEAIQVAREMAVANGYANRIEFIEDISTRVRLPEYANIIISDLRGTLPLTGHHLTAIIDARKRFLAAGGVLIPQKDVLWAAVVSAPELYRTQVQVWEDHDYGLRVEPVRRIMVNTWDRGSVKPDQLLAAPCVWGQLDYTIIESTDLEGEVHFSVSHDGVGHGLVIWFDMIAADNIGFSNAPGGGAKVYGSGFFPWTEAVSLAEGDRVETRIRAKLVGDEYVWIWDTAVFKDDKGPCTEFHQSSFLAHPLSTSRLRKQSDNFVPRLNQEGLIDQCVLELMNSELSQAEIARQIRERFPARFRNTAEALTHVGKMSERYSE